jgi:hypothetical protein
MLRCDAKYGKSSGKKAEKSLHGLNAENDDDGADGMRLGRCGLSEQKKDERHKAVRGCCGSFRGGREALDAFRTTIPVKSKSNCWLVLGICCWMRRTERTVLTKGKERTEVCATTSSTITIQDIGGHNKVNEEGQV